MIVTLALATIVNASPPEASAAALPDPGLPAEIMAAVDPARMLADVEQLAAFGTRHSLSDADSTQRGIGAARRWLFEQMKQAGVPAVNMESFRAPKSQRLPDGAMLANIVGIVPGTDNAARDRLYYVVGHYDSRNGETMDAVGDAPGANDDASGTSVVLELARVIAKKPLRSTVVFLCTDAEEAGLIGAKHHAEEAAARNAMILGVLNNDIVGDPSPAGDGPDAGIVRIFSEGLPRAPSAEQLASIRANSSEYDSPSRQLARFVAEIAMREKTALQPRVVMRLDRFLRGGDHSAFSDLGFPAVRFSVPAEDYSRQHANVRLKDGKPYGDLPAFVNKDYLAGVARMNAASLVHMACAPAPPQKVRILTRELSTDTVLAWDAPTGGADGYEVVWRETTAWQWQSVRDAGEATTLRLAISKDNVFFGVRSYSRDGYRSPVTFAAAARD